MSKRLGSRYVSGREMAKKKPTRGRLKGHGTGKKAAERFTQPDALRRSKQLGALR